MSPPARPSLNRTMSKDQSPHEQPKTVWNTFQPHSHLVWAIIVIGLAIKYFWARSWIISGAPLLGYILIAKAGLSDETLSLLWLWACLATVNLAYAISTTSWVLYLGFVSVCWPVTAVACLYQFPFTANSARQFLRALLSQLHFINDKIAFFDLPALEIDTEVAGLMVIRGLTLSLSTLTIEAHGVEVGIKLTDDMELAIQVELVQVFLFRRIEISDIYANLKGGIHEMTFGELEESTEDAEGNPLMDFDTSLIRAATAKVDEMMAPEKVKMTEHMTDGKHMKDQTPQGAKKSWTQISPNDERAVDKYNQIMEDIKATNSIEVIRRRVKKQNQKQESLTGKERRAAICSLLHDGPSIPHPPHHSIKVTTLQTLSKPSVRRTLHRLPFLLRLLLNPVSYFHPVHFSSITAAASGAWIKHMLMNNIFKEYAEDDSDLKGIRKRIMSWLSDANFTLQLDNIKGVAQVPIITEYNINCLLSIKDIIVSRTSPKQIDLHEVARFGGADATFSIPSYLLPHHEHLLPPIPTHETKQDLTSNIDNADGQPQKLKAERDLEQAEKDETNMTMSVHAQLPACFDQALLDFIAALVKATKLIEMDKDKDKDRDTEVEADDNDTESIAESVTSEKGTSKRLALKEFARNLNTSTKNSIKKVAVNSIVNDRWIAKLVGKVTKMLETAHGDIGYSGDIPIALAPYREKGRGELSKILP